MNKINILIYGLMIVFSIQGTYLMYIQLSNKQSLSFWIIEVIHHLVTAFILFGVFIINKSYKYIVIHLVLSLFVFIHWYFNIYVLRVQRCILSFLSNKLINSKCRYVYKNPLKYLIGIKHEDSCQNRNVVQNLPNIIDKIIIISIILYDTFLLSKKIEQSRIKPLSP
jgi:hypothetical protein